jgi:hypothetical protein
MTERSNPALRRLEALDEARREANPGVRLEALRKGARELREELKEAGSAVSVRTRALVTFPYPTKHGFSGAARSPAPYVMLRNRMQLVQVDSDDGLINILVNPSDPERSQHAPFFAQQIEKLGDFLAKRVFASFHGTVADALSEWDVSPADIDYITFDHMHVQDVRGLLGTTAAEPGNSEPTKALLPNAKLIIQKDELRTFECLHPMQSYWYVRDGVRDVAEQKLLVVDGDYAIGTGFALVRTPGHTDGNHTPVVVTGSGVWTISENGVAVESYAPECSKIAGLKGYAREANAEVVLNGNTREDSIDQYNSMVLEKTLADPCRERPEFPQHFPSSELVASKLAPGLSPTFSHGSITHGTLRTVRTGSKSQTAA